MIKLLRFYRYDIMQLYGFRVSLIGRMAAQFVQPRPIIVHGIRGLHVTESEEVSSHKTRAVLTVERLAARMVDAYLANSNGAVNFLCNWGLPPEKFSVVPNGIDISEWDEALVRPVREPVTIICVANFRPRKRHCDLLEALALLHASGLRLRCRFVGDGPTRQHVVDQAKLQGVHDIVEFLGSCEPEEVKALLSEADIFVLPSLWEGLPGSVMEAMASGLPVVGTDVNGTNELVIEGETGFLVPPRSPDALAERLARLAKDPHMRNEMGQRGWKRIAEGFTLDAMIKRTEMFYRSIMETHQPLSQHPVGGALK